MSYQVLGIVSTILVALLAAGGAFAAAVVSARANARAASMSNSIERRRVDRDDFDSITRELNSALKRVETDLQEAEMNLKAMSAEKTEERLAWEQERDRLRRRVRQLERLLREHGIELPDEVPRDDPAAW